MPGYRITEHPAPVARYQPFGPTRGWTWGNGTLHVREYDVDGRITHLDSAGLKTYSHDDAFRITGITDATNPALSRTYGYDLLDRLTSAVGTASNQSWTYDANGNRLGESSSTPATYTISGTSNRLTAIAGALNRSYTHDAAGNITSDGTVSFSYDDAGRMVSAVSAGGNATYSLNALGQRVKKTAPGGTTYFVYDEAGHLLGEYNGSGVIKQEIIWLDDIPVVVLRRDASGNYNPHYIHTDHLNTPRQISRASNNVVRWRWDADPFGVGAADADPDGDSYQFVFNLRFPGQYYDAETGLYYNYMRDYDPQTGRYVQSDPIGLKGGLNTYAYVRGNPISGTDRFGLADSQPDPRPDIPFPDVPSDTTGAGEKAQRACDAEGNRADAEKRAADARARDDWDKYYEEMGYAHRWLRRYYDALGITIPEYSTPHGPFIPRAEPPIPAPALPTTPDIAVPVPRL